MDPGEVPSAERGSLKISDRVVAKVAAQAAREALRPQGRARTKQDPPARLPGADVAVREWSARVRVVLELGYPSDIGAQCGAVRRQVARRVRELVGMDVPDVSVEVERLRSAELDGEAPGRVR